jgi:hypothetical protein
MVSHVLIALLAAVPIFEQKKPMGPASKPSQEAIEAALPQTLPQRPPAFIQLVDTQADMPECTLQSAGLIVFLLADRSLNICSAESVESCVDWTLQRGIHGCSGFQGECSTALCTRIRRGGVRGGSRHRRGGQSSTWGTAPQVELTEEGGCFCAKDSHCSERMVCDKFRDGKAPRWVTLAQGK